MLSLSNSCGAWIPTFACFRSTAAACGTKTRMATAACFLSCMAVCFFYRMLARGGCMAARGTEMRTAAGFLSCTAACGAAAPSSALRCFGCLGLGPSPSRFLCLRLRQRLLDRALSCGAWILTAACFPFCTAASCLP